MKKNTRFLWHSVIVCALIIGAFACDEPTSTPDSEPPVADAVEPPAAEAVLNQQGLTYVPPDSNAYKPDSVIQGWVCIKSCLHRFK